MGRFVSQVRDSALKFVPYALYHLVIGVCKPLVDTLRIEVLAKVLVDSTSHN